MSSHLKVVEYIWLDGNKEMSQIRSKTRIISVENSSPAIKDFPEWNFDGSSTQQATGDDSDCILKPVCFVKDPIQHNGDYLVLCEVYTSDNKPHPSNARSKLREVMEQGGNKYEPWIGFEQEYTMYRRNIPLGWPEHGFPAPQGPYYCGVGSEQIFGRELALDHKDACLDSGIIYYGMNAEVMPGQWEFQIGYRGNKNEDAGVVNICDHLWIARWLIHRLSEKYNIHISFDNKPVKGDWNGAGMHTNFSTNETRDTKQGLEAIKNAINKLSATHQDHISVYGYNLSSRLTGLHETSDINTFSSGNSDRGSSIRIPINVAAQGYGYIEDRRPGANADPYLVAQKLVKSICLN